MSSRPIDLVTSVYDAVLDPRGLGAFADVLTEMFSASSGVLHEIEGGRAPATVSSGIPSRVLDLYHEHYQAVNPLLPAGLARVPVGRPVLLADLMPESAYFESEFFRDFAKGADTAWLLGVMVPVGPSLLVAINVHRPLEGGDFSPVDRAKLRSLVGPARGAFRLRGRLGERREAGFAAFEALAFGAIVCDADGRVLFANRAAEALAARGSGLLLGGRHGGVSAASPGQADRLAVLVRRAGASGEAGAMTLAGAAGETVFLLVTPLPRRFGGASPLVLITARAAEPAPVADPATLAALFGLTPAEARVAAALSAGHGIHAIATGLEVGEETIRTHVKRFFAKAGVSTQREFVALVALIPPVRDGRGGP